MSYLEKQSVVSGDNRVTEERSRCLAETIRDIVCQVGTEGHCTHLRHTHACSHARSLLPLTLVQSWENLLDERVES